MSVSQHPVALRLERQVGGATRLLATVMGLPLVDGIFPALIIAGALSEPIGILETGLLIFGGSATVAVILAEMDESPREQIPSILLLGAVLIPLAALEAMFAHTIDNVLNLAIFQRFAGLVILTIAAKTASSRVGEYLPRPGVIIGLGLIASAQPPKGAFTVSFDPILVAHAAGAAAVGVGFALSIALFGPRLRGAVDIDLFRFGSSVALGMLALSVLKVPGMPTDAPVALGVLCVTAVFAYDPGPEAPDAPPAPEADADSDDTADEDTDLSTPVDAAIAGPDSVDEDRAEDDRDQPNDEPARAPWL